jgi:NAD(P)-dependent dehydrogenase (short-subunit alcohol dehydrogenase family)
MRPVLVVTGGSQGIGAAVARLAAVRGYAVAISYQRAKAAADAVAGDIKRAGGDVITTQAEMADESSVMALFEATDRALGPVTALVNNAGITGPIATLADVSSAILDEVMAVNVSGAFLALREAVRRMATDRGGRGGAVVNISSRAAALGGPNEWVHYAASKGAVDTLTIGAAKELAPKGIRVNAVSPGLIDTEIHAKAGMPDRAQRMGSGVPLGRAGTAEEVARVVMWLLSEEASYVTGAIVPVSGGR